VRCWGNLEREDLLTGQDGVCIRFAVEQHRIPLNDEEVACVSSRSAEGGEDGADGAAVKRGRHRSSELPKVHVANSQAAGARRACSEGVDRHLLGDSASEPLLGILHLLGLMTRRRVACCVRCGLSTLVRTAQGQGGRERSGDVRGSCASGGKTGESLGAEHVRAVLKIFVQVRLERGAACLILRSQTFFCSSSVADEYAGDGQMTFASHACCACACLWY
jgi:hypothetical protein